MIVGYFGVSRVRWGRCVYHAFVLYLLKIIVIVVHLGSNDNYFCPMILQNEGNPTWSTEGSIDSSSCFTKFHRKWNEYFYSSSEDKADFINNNIVNSNNIEYEPESAFTEDRATMKVILNQYPIMWGMRQRSANPSTNNQRRTGLSSE